MGAIRRAVVSVSDKAGVVEFCQALADQGVTILSTGGTARALRDGQVPVTDVSAYTESPEIMDGRVKTLHPRIHGGILMRDTASDREELARIGGAPIDWVIVNLYPFAATLARGAAHDEVMENIDIGGPCLIRAAAKNHARVTVVVDPADYQQVARAGAQDAALRANLAAKAFAHVADYDRAIATYLARKR
jgi:phosphoribosylaminoimidazolecarboxamide formyltransferase/IMP cyclohydrolase